MHKKPTASLIRGDLYRNSFYERLIIEVRKTIFQGLTKNALPLFLRVGDIISISPILRGTYEPQINALFDALSGIGFSDYLLDIGANIGLTTVQNSSRFQSIFAYEPNPTAFAVLTANCQQIDSKRLHLYPFGIGMRDEVLELRVPRGNMDGGFISGDDNYYSDDAIVAKESSQQIDDTSYEVVQVEIRCGSVILREVFEALREAGQTAGAIKIDAEGYELTILKQIAAGMRDGIEFVAVFENWKAALMKEQVLDIFAGRGFVYKLEWNMGSLSKLRQFMQLAARGE
jgi:FkbM family methyltransferase